MKFLKGTGISATYSTWVWNLTKKEVKTCFEHVCNHSDQIRNFTRDSLTSDFSKSRLITCKSLLTEDFFNVSFTEVVRSSCSKISVSKIVLHWETTNNFGEDCLKNLTMQRRLKPLREQCSLILQDPWKKRENYYLFGIRTRSSSFYARALFAAPSRPCSVFYFFRVLFTHT